MTDEEDKNSGKNIRQFTKPKRPTVDDLEPVSVGHGCQTVNGDELLCFSWAVRLHGRDVRMVCLGCGSSCTLEELVEAALSED